jgi:hypothetical protein
MSVDGNTVTRTIKIREHIPNFVSGYEPREASLNEGQSFLDVPWIADKQKIPTFGQFSICRASQYDDYDTLMMEMCDGKYWVVAFITPKGMLPRMRTWESPQKDSL